MHRHGVCKVVCETQGEKSEELLDYVLNDFDLSSASGNAYVNVNYVGKYNKTLIGSIGDAATVIGFLSLVASFAAKEYLAYKAIAISAKASKALNVFSSIGNTATVVGFGCYATNKLSKLPNGKYDQYTVTISWVQTTPDLFNGLTIHDQICVTMQYVWNDACECGGCWYLLGEVWDQKTTNLYH